MKKILFVCHGNICRSPMAEFILKNMVNERNISNDYYIESAATSLEEIGNDLYYKTKEILKEKNIPFTKRHARVLTKDDYNKFDLIIGMDSYNIRNILNILGEDPLHKVIKLQNFDIEDPWYSNNFEKVFNEIMTGCLKLLD